MGPDDFLFLADRLGLMGMVGDQVRARAAENVARWFRSIVPAPDIYVSANASVGELADGFADTLTAAWKVQACRAAATGWRLPKRRSCVILNGPPPSCMR